MEVVKTDDDRAREIVLKYDPKCAQGDDYRRKMIFQRCRSEIDEYLWAVDYIIQQFMQSGSLEAGTVRRQLLDEFETILNHVLSTKQTVSENPSTYSCTTRSYSLGFCFENDPTSSVLDDLRSIARRLRSMGCLRDCQEIYSAIRETFFDATLTRFGIAKLSAGDVQKMVWQELDRTIGLWVGAAPFHVHLITMEIHACQSIFKVENAPFLMQIVRAYVNPFLDFVSAVARGRRSSERLFGMLDLHGCLTLMLPPLELLKLPGAEALVKQAKQILSALEEAARETFLRFERAVVGDLSCVDNVREGVHHLTTYVMDYLTRIVSGYGKCEWIVARNIDDILWIGDTFSGKTPHNVHDCCDQPPLASHIKLVIANLLCNLRGKTKEQELDDGFACFFMMVNLNHVVQKLKESELVKVVGEDFKSCLENALQSTVFAHLSSTWDRVLKGLEQGLVPKKIKLLGMSISGPCRRKGILKDFNVAFERIQQTQCRWVVRDWELREGLRQCILKRLVPAYDSFLHQLSQCRSSRKATKLIKYSVEDLENAVCCQLFEGRPPSPFRSK
ncbi:PREDICTED: exocyst complex component EXO70B1-like [Ipomoea nil]|uniref:exocyst complex component EXO70B1-like n=1 Tax=Ipomoea nil TaxID=35883 RepID=UPI000900FF52|nr:PREDICTED: exocyst complex component EXO70B1-like [Ipomoea nil]